MILYYKDRVLYNEFGEIIVKDIELKINPKLPKYTIFSIKETQGQFGKFKIEGVIRLKYDPYVQAFDDDFGEIVLTDWNFLMFGGKFYTS